MTSQPEMRKQQAKRHLFGTDGVRGVANQEPMTWRLIGQAQCHEEMGDRA